MYYNMWFWCLQRTEVIESAMTIVQRWSNIDCDMKIVRLNTRFETSPASKVQYYWGTAEPLTVVLVIVEMGAYKKVFDHEFNVICSIKVYRNAKQLNNSKMIPPAAVSNLCSQISLIQIRRHWLLTMPKDGRSYKLKAAWYYGLWTSFGKYKHLL